MYTPNKIAVNYYSLLLITALKFLLLTDPPSLLISFNETVYNTSDTLLLYCIFSSFPASNITWYRKTVSASTMIKVNDGNRSSIEFITGNSLMEELSGSGSGLGVSLYEIASNLYAKHLASSALPVAVSILEIEKLVYEDEGNYTCRADNNIRNLIDSVVFNTAYITVQSKIIINLT